MKRNQKNLGNIFIALVIIVVLVVAGFYLLKKKAATPLFYPHQQTNTNRDAQSDNDLLNASQDLDNTDIDGTVDPQLNQNDIDAQTF